MSFFLLIGGPSLPCFLLLRYGDETFSTRSADGRVVDLVPGGRKKHLQLASAGEYVRLMFGYHLHEFDEALGCVGRGLATQVPLTALRLFTAPQLELLVTGRTEVDLVLLKRWLTHAPLSSH